MHSFQHGERVLCLFNPLKPYGHDCIAFFWGGILSDLHRFVFVDLHRGDGKREVKAGNTMGKYLGVWYTGQGLDAYVL